MSPPGFHERGSRMLCHSCLRLRHPSLCLVAAVVVAVGPDAKAVVAVGAGGLVVEAAVAEGPELTAAMCLCLT